MTRDDVLMFIWGRFGDYRAQKTQTDQWDRDGNTLREIANRFQSNSDEFVGEVKRLIGVGNS